ncbi:MAG: hypothetical protein KC502_00985 [Myxococcales bacterium]|nr:hypothetical protein [Myxococcales bacterium]
MSYPTRVLLVGALLLSACGSEGGGDANAGARAPVLPGFGQACEEGECAAGLACADGDWAPRPWCTKACTNPGDYCDTADLGATAGLCVTVPSDFKGELKTFCAPICNNTDTCKSNWSQWQKCTKPAWKNTDLYPALPTKVCQSPDSHGQVVIDPVICDWESKVTDPKYTNAKQVCKAYCNFLKTCQLWQTSKEKLDCCRWRCFQEMTPSGVVNDEIEDKKKCYIKAFNSAQGTPKVCTIHEEQCAPIGDPHAP